jgi:hypothetical protein
MKRWSQRRKLSARCWWLTPLIPATQEAEIRNIVVPSQPKEFMRPHLEKTLHKKGLMEWLKM